MIEEKWSIERMSEEMDLHVQVTSSTSRAGSYDTEKWRRRIEKLSDARKMLYPHMSIHNLEY